MIGFACLDDSLAYKNNLYVYTHAVVCYEDTPDVLTIVGDKLSIYKHENEIYKFLLNIVPEDLNLYACGHYLMYKNIWNDMVYDAAETDGSCVERYMKKEFIRTFYNTHNAAKISAKENLALILNSR